jgi:hypothetical protein
MFGIKKGSPSAACLRYGFGSTSPLTLIFRACSRSAEPMWRLLALLLNLRRRRHAKQKVSETFIWLIPIGAITSARLPCYLAKRWGRWWLSLVAVPLGVSVAVGLSLVVAAALHFLNPNAFPMADLLITVLGSLTWSVVISPIAALIGWPKGRVSRVSKTTCKPMDRGEAHAPRLPSAKRRPSLA